MALKNICGWNSSTETTAAAACGTACGASDQPQEKPAACGSACQAADQPQEKPAACGSACGSACGAADQQ